LVLSLIVASLLLEGISNALLRALPDSAKRATIGQQLYALPFIDLGGMAAKLAPGAVIFDQNNLSLVHSALPPGANVAFTIDINGDIARGHLWTAFEQAQFDQKK
jgi:hypothetical protein